MPFITASLRRYQTPLIWVGGFLLFSLFIILNLNLATYLRYLLLGLPMGAVIALIAVGYSMVYGIIQLINFAHGEVFMFSAYFVLMLIAPPVSENDAAARAVSMTVAFIVGCAVWVVLERPLPKRLPRGAVAAAVGAGFGYLNWHLMPLPGGAAVVPFMAAYMLAMIYACCLGVTMDLIAYRPLRRSPRLIPLITAIGISLFLQNFAQALFESRSQTFPTEAIPEALTGERIVLYEGNGPAEAISIARLDVIIVVLAVVLLGGLQLFIHNTRTGKAMRACAQDRTTASLLGIQVNRVVSLAFALGAGLAAIVAPLYVLRGTPISPQMGYIVGILAFSSAVLGGIGNVTGAMLGGMIIGLIYNFVPLFDAPDRFALVQTLDRWGWISSQKVVSIMHFLGQPGQYQLGVAYAFMILIIVFRPTGLLGKASANRA